MPTPPSRPGAPPRSVRGRGPVLSATCLLALTGCGAAPEDSLDGAVPASRTAPASSSTMSAGDGTVATTRLPVYWVGAADGEQVLFREFHDAPEGSSAVDPIAAAAEQMTVAAPDDPDYRSLWSPAEEVGSATSPDGTITVDLPSEAFRSGLTDREAHLALQQLAHTVTSTATTAGLLPGASHAEVVVLVDGRPDEEVFGSVRLDEPLRPDEALEAPVWLVDPREGAHEDGVVTISGRALAGVSGTRWTVTDQDDASGRTVASGTVAVGSREAGSTRFAAEVELPPGEYVVTVVGRDADGETVRDDKTVEVLPR